jgi:hypothetical protein
MNQYLIISLRPSHKTEQIYRVLWKLILCLGLLTVSLQKVMLVILVDTWYLVTLDLVEIDLDVETKLFDLWFKIEQEDSLL